MKQRRRIAGALVLLPVVGAVGTIAQDYDLHRNTLDGGGVLFATGGVFSLSATVGQPDAGLLSGGTFTVAGGFWFPQLPGDCNLDGGVDLHDYESFEACLTGPGGGLSGGSCTCFDFDGDADVDMGDVRQFQDSFSG